MEVKAWDLYLDFSETITSDELEPSISAESLPEDSLFRQHKFKKRLKLISFYLRHLYRHIYSWFFLSMRNNPRRPMPLLYPSIWIEMLLC
ncbi:MAG: hypothetical protein ACI9LE_001743 [Paraglaciecola sp.]